MARRQMGAQWVTSLAKKAFKFPAKDKIFPKFPVFQFYDAIASEPSVKLARGSSVELIA